MRRKRKSGDAVWMKPSNLCAVTPERRELRNRSFAPGPTIVLVLLALLVPSGLAAKKKAPPTKTIQGEVLDAANMPIVGAAVELADETNHKTLGIHSEAGGRYKFTGLTPAHDYQVKASYKGQQSDVRNASSLDTRGVVVLNLTIPAPSPQ